MQRSRRTTTHIGWSPARGNEMSIMIPQPASRPRDRHFTASSNELNLASIHCAS